MAATLFYEGAVAEALALVIERAAAIEAERAEGSAPSLSKEDRAALDDLSAHINGNLAGALSCEELARRACMGQTKLKAAFKAAYGTSPAAFVADARIERAIELLNSTDEPIAHIARAVATASPARSPKPSAAAPACPPAPTAAQRLSGGDRGIVEGRASNETRTNVSRETFGRPDADPCAARGETTQGEERNVRGSCAAAYVARLALFRIRA